MEESPSQQDHGTCFTEGDNGLSKISINLRPLNVSDIDAFMVWATDKEVARFCTWEPYTSKEDGINFIKDKVIPHPWFRAICINDTPIGAISVTANSGNDKCRGELGYVLGTKYWGKGIATEAVKMVSEIIFKEWPHLVRLEALVDVENIGSQRVLEKVGFLREGILRKYMLLKGRSLKLVADLLAGWLGSRGEVCVSCLFERSGPFAVTTFA
uniref:N-acetyltransferase domain-containing protein n=1 Tax=Cannabis sativa TaxID=3483 RepID=A0A803Q1A3_CANSA